MTCTYCPFSVIVPLNYNVGLILYSCSVWSCYETSTISIMKNKFVFTAGLYQCITSFCVDNSTLVLTGVCIFWANIINNLYMLKVVNNTTRYKKNVYSRN